MQVVEILRLTRNSKPARFLNRSMRHPPIQFSCLMLLREFLN